VSAHTATVYQKGTRILHYNGLAGFVRWGSYINRSNLRGHPAELPADRQQSFAIHVEKEIKAPVQRRQLAIVSTAGNLEKIKAPDLKAPNVTYKE
jgi:hypothetical protein